MLVIVNHLGERERATDIPNRAMMANGFLFAGGIRKRVDPKTGYSINAGTTYTSRRFGLGTAAMATEIGFRKIEGSFPTRFLCHGPAGNWRDTAGYFICIHPKTAWRLRIVSEPPTTGKMFSAN